MKMKKIQIFQQVTGDKSGVERTHDLFFFFLHFNIYSSKGLKKKKNL